VQPLDLGQHKTFVEALSLLLRYREMLESRLRSARQHAGLGKQPAKLLIRPTSPLPAVNIP
jgi:hypothetical protein